MNNDMPRILSLIAVFAFISCSPKKDAQEVLREAGLYVTQGKYAEALENHIWVHKHSLEKQPAFYGVRLSFALQSWVNLGKQYPPALEALRKIRDENVSNLLAAKADKHAFIDVKSINYWLGETSATADLFKKIASSQSALAASVYSTVEEALFEAGEYELSRKYMGDPLIQLADAKAAYERSVQVAKSNKDLGMVALLASGNFVNHVVRIITVLDKSGEREKAVEIQQAALKTLDNEGIRKAVKN